jgi:acetyl-CoA C-acetyltransferase
VSPGLSDVVICEPVRTPVGRYGGSLRDFRAHELGAVLLRGLLERVGMRPDAVDEVLLGNCYPSMEAPAIGRVVALDAGLPVTVAGQQIDRRCGSGLQAVIDAVTRVQTGACEVVVAGGVESMSRAVFYNDDDRFSARSEATVYHDSLARGRVTAGGRNHPVARGMIETAENLRREFGIPRHLQDELAYRSHQRAVAAQTSGHFAEEILPIEVPHGRETYLVSIDEHPRPDTTVEALASLRPILQRFDENATVTAGNASGQNDGAALCIVTTRAKAEELGLAAFGSLVSWAVCGVEPACMGIGPVPSVARALDRVGLRLADMDLIEINEAFAAQVLACTGQWGFGPPGHGDWDRINVNGSGISLGHPVGATGARILATMLRELRRRGGRYAVETMCIGGGQGLAAVFEASR